VKIWTKVKCHVFVAHGVYYLELHKAVSPKAVNRGSRCSSAESPLFPTSYDISCPVWFKPRTRIFGHGKAQKYI